MTRSDDDEGNRTPFSGLDKQQHSEGGTNSINNQNGHDEINNFMETITNLEAFDMKLKETEQYRPTKEKRRQATVSAGYKESLHLTNQTLSIENSAIVLRE